MSILDDPKSIMGIGEIMVDTDDEFDIDDLEKSIIKGSSYNKNTNTADISKEYKNELEKLSNQFGIDSKFKSQSSFGNQNSKIADSFGTSQFENEEESEDDEPASFGQTNGGSLGGGGFGGGSNSYSNGGSNYLNNNGSGFGSGSGQPSEFNSNNKYTSQFSGQFSNEGTYQTVEEMRQANIKKVLNNIDKNEDTVAFINEEDEEDEMAKILEHIDQLTTNLTAEGVDLSRIPSIHAGSTRKEARSVLKVLQIKNDKLRYCDIFEEVILSGAFMLESTFDGKKSFFGNQIDLTGWPDSVKVKLRRMRYDTSSFVGEVVKGYNIGSGWRILFELLPSLFLYSRDRRIRSNDNLVSDDKYKNAINELNSK
jgi:hypothetical protein